MRAFHLHVIFSTHLQDLEDLIAFETAEFKYRHGSLPFKAYSIEVARETVKCKLEFFILFTRLAWLCERQPLNIAEMRDICKPFVFSMTTSFFLTISGGFPMVPENMGETNWYVVTGAPSSGKTTLVRELERLGYRVVHEVARGYIEAQMDQGRTLEEVRGDKRSFETHILNAKVAIEEKLPKDEVIIFDRAIPDSIAYFEAAGLDKAEPVEKSPRNRYRKVFLLDRLPYKTDHARIEDKKTAMQLDEGLEQSYKMLGYNVLRIPVMSVQERLNLVLKEINNQQSKIDNRK
jgi:predicted ATPase